MHREYRGGRVRFIYSSLVSLLSFSYSLSPPSFFPLSPSHLSLPLSSPSLLILLSLSLPTSLPPSPSLSRLDCGSTREAGMKQRLTMELLTTSSTWPSKAPKTAHRSEWVQYIMLENQFIRNPHWFVKWNVF